MKETIHSMIRRCKRWDYNGIGLYMITLVLSDRTAPWLGELRQFPSDSHSNENAPCGIQRLNPDGSRAWYIAPTPLGNVVTKCWRKISENWPGVEALEIQLMPEHIHGNIHVLKHQKHPLGQIIGSFKAQSTAAARKLPSGIPPGVRNGKSLWQNGFQDSILYTQERQARAREYLLNNPFRLAVKHYAPMFFRVIREVRVDLGEGRTGYFSSIGNIFLLNSVDFLQIQVSRRFFAYRRNDEDKPLKEEPPVVETAEFRALWERVHVACVSKGATLVSPCLSDGEREITRRAFLAGAKVIVLTNQGFSPLYKPHGKLFNLCARGNLLMLAPSAWPYLPGKKPITRTDALILNRLAQWISRDWTAPPNDYHGQIPPNLDQMALQATRKNAPLRV